MAVKENVNRLVDTFVRISFFCMTCFILFAFLASDSRLEQLYDLDAFHGRFSPVSSSVLLDAGRYLPISLPGL